MTVGCKSDHKMNDSETSTDSEQLKPIVDCIYN